MLLLLLLVRLHGTVAFTPAALFVPQVCDAGFDRREADVACKQLGLSSDFVPRAVPGAYFGAGTRSVLVQLQCTGGEESLADCFYTIAPNCTHAQDAGVICAPVTGAQ